MLVDGDLVLTESAAIVTYLGDKYGGLTPSVGSVERARYDEWTSFILMELDAHTLYVMRKHGDLAALYGEAPAAMQAARKTASTSRSAGRRAGWAATPLSR